VDVLLLRNLTLNESGKSMQHLNSGDKVEASTPEMSKSQAHDAYSPEPPSVRTTTQENLSHPLSKN
jgi:hypothetical protein